MHLLIVIATEGDKESAPHLIICLQNRWQWWEIRQFLIPMFVWRCPNIKTEGATLGWQIYGCIVDGAVNEVQGSESIWRKRNGHCFGSHHVVGFFDDGPNKVLLMGQSHFLMCPQLDWKYSYKPKASFLTWMTSLTFSLLAQPMDWFRPNQAWAMLQGGRRMSC